MRNKFNAPRDPEANLWFVASVIALIVGASYGHYFWNVGPLSSQNKIQINLDHLISAAPIFMLCAGLATAAFLGAWSSTRAAMAGASIVSAGLAVLALHGSISKIPSVPASDLKSYLQIAFVAYFVAGQVCYWLGRLWSVLYRVFVDKLDLPKHGWVGEALPGFLALAVAGCFFATRDEDSFWKQVLLPRKSPSYLAQQAKALRMPISSEPLETKHAAALKICEKYKNTSCRTFFANHLKDPRWCRNGDKYDQVCLLTVALQQRSADWCGLPLQLGFQSYCMTNLAAHAKNPALCNDMIMPEQYPCKTGQAKSECETYNSVMKLDNAGQRFACTGAASQTIANCLVDEKMDAKFKIQCLTHVAAAQKNTAACEPILKLKPEPFSPEYIGCKSQVAQLTLQASDFQKNKAALLADRKGDFPSYTLGCMREDNDCFTYRAYDFRNPAMCYSHKDADQISMCLTLLAYANGDPGLCDFLDLEQQNLCMDLLNLKRNALKTLAEMPTDELFDPLKARMTTDRQTQAVEHCGQVGGRLPTAREFATFAVQRCKPTQSIGCPMLLEVLDYTSGKIPAGMDPKSFSVVRSSNTGGQEDVFYFRQFQKHRDAVSPWKGQFWTSSADPSAPAWTRTFVASEARFDLASTVNHAFPAQVVCVPKEPQSSPSADKAPGSAPNGKCVVRYVDRPLQSFALNRASLRTRIDNPHQLHFGQAVCEEVSQATDLKNITIRVRDDGRIGTIDKTAVSADFVSAEDALKRAKGFESRRDDQNAKFWCARAVDSDELSKDPTRRTAMETACSEILLPMKLPATAAYAAMCSHLQVVPGCKTTRYIRAARALLRTPDPKLPATANTVKSLSAGDAVCIMQENGAWAEVTARDNSKPKEFETTQGLQFCSEPAKCKRQLQVKYTPEAQGWIPKESMTEKIPLDRENYFISWIAKTLSVTIPLPPDVTIPTNLLAKIERKVVQGAPDGPFYLLPIDSLAELRMKNGLKVGGDVYFVVGSIVYQAKVSRILLSARCDSESQSKTVDLYIQFGSPEPMEKSPSGPPLNSGTVVVADHDLKFSGWRALTVTDAERQQVKALLQNVFKDKEKSYVDTKEATAIQSPRGKLVYASWADPNEGEWLSSYWGFVLFPPKSSPQVFATGNTYGGMNLLPDLDGDGMPEFDEACGYKGYQITKIYPSPQPYLACFGSN